MYGLAYFDTAVSYVCKHAYEIYRPTGVNLMKTFFFVAVETKQARVFVPGKFYQARKVRAYLN